MKTLNVDNYEQQNLQAKINIMKNLNNGLKVIDNRNVFDLYDKIPLTDSDGNDYNLHELDGFYSRITQLFFILLFDGFYAKDIYICDPEDTNELIEQFCFTDEEIIQMIESENELHDLKIITLESNIFKQTFKICDKTLNIRLKEHIIKKIQNIFYTDNTLDDYLYYRKRIKVNNSEIVILGNEFTVANIVDSIPKIIKLLDKCKKFNERGEDI